MRRVKTLRLGVLFVLPAVVMYSVFMFYPVVQTLWLSFFKWGGYATVAPTFVGLANFKYMFDDPVFWRSLGNVLIYLLINVVIQIPVGFLLALFLAAAPVGMRLFKAAFFIPVVLSAVAVSLMWRFILSPDGLLNALLDAVGLGDYTTMWLVEPGVNMPTIATVGAWQGVGYVMILLLAALVNIPQSLVEQAVVDGANAWQRTIHVVVPLMRPALITNIILLIIGSVKVCDIVFVMTGGGPVHSSEVLATYMYNTAFREGTFGLGSAIASAIFVLAALLTVITSRAMRKQEAEF